MGREAGPGKKAALPGLPGLLIQSAEKAVGMEEPVSGEEWFTASERPHAVAG